MRRPHVLLTADEVRQAVKDLRDEPRFVIDVETTGLRHRDNQLRWVGLGAEARCFLIPCKHPKGVLISPQHRAKKPAYLLYPHPDPRGMTKLRKPSQAMKDYTEPAVYAEPPDQLRPHQVCELIEPLLWSDRHKLGHNVKFDLLSMAKYFDGEIPPGPYDDTIILRHCLAEDLASYSLKELTCDWFKIHWTKRAAFYPNLGKTGTDNYSLDEVARYLAKDVRYCWLMFQAFYPLLAKRGVQETYDFEMSVYPVIMAMEHAGFPVDTSKMDMVRDDLAKQQKKIQEEAWSHAGDKFSLNNTNAKRWIMFGEPVIEIRNGVKKETNVHGVNKRVAQLAEPQGTQPYQGDRSSR